MALHTWACCLVPLPPPQGHAQVSLTGNERHVDQSSSSPVVSVWTSQLTARQATDVVREPSLDQQNHPVDPEQTQTHEP